jgi:uncharacterized membrane protein
MKVNYWDWFVSVLWLMLVVIALNELREPAQKRVLIGFVRARISILLFTVAVLIGWLDVLLVSSRGATNLVLQSVGAVLTATAIAISPWRARKAAQR